MLVVGGIQVYCAFKEIADIVTLVPNPRNPNQHPEKQIELLAKIIKAQGWRTPITVSNRSGFIVRGHGRLKAAQLLGVDKVPVDRQDYASEAEEWADLIADNRIAELAEIDSYKLKELLDELSTEGLDLTLTGYDQSEIERLMEQFGVPDTDFPEYDESVEKDVKRVVCPECGHEFPV